MDEKQETYAEKIAKLLAKAESTTPEEAELLMSKAQELMTKYAIDEAMLRSLHLNTINDPLVKEEFVITGIYRFPLSALTHFIMINNSVKAVKLSGDNWREINGRVFRQTVILVGIGYKSDIDAVRLMNSSLHIQAMRAESEWWRKSEKLYSKRESHYARRQFLQSFAEGAHSKMRLATEKGKAAAAAQHGSDSVALVLRSKEQNVLDEFKKHFPNTRSVSSNRKGGDEWARNHGYEAGRKADVGQPGVGTHGSPRARLGQ